MISNPNKPTTYIGRVPVFLMSVKFERVNSQRIYASQIRIK
jgi:hypothetical protein